MEEQKQIRCAIYTRKSTDEGLEKEFNMRTCSLAFVARHLMNSWLKTLTKP